jgi:hypothetical protein
MPKKHKLCIGGSAGGKLRMVSLVRGTRTSGGAEVILVYDFIEAVYEKSAAEARQIWRALRARTNDAAYRGPGYMYYEVALNRAGDVEGTVPAMTAQGLQRLQEVLGLEVAERFRVQRALVFERCVPYAGRIAEREARRAM